MTSADFWKEGDRSRAVCEDCGKLVETRFEYRDYQLEVPRRVVPDVLVAVCTECDRTVAVPYQSSPKLNEARKVEEAPLEARVPKHLEDVLAVVASRYGRHDREFRAVVLRFYLHALAENEGLAEHVRELSTNELARGPATGRVSLKMQKPVLTRAWERARQVGLRSKTDMVKGAIVVAAEDLKSKQGRRRREVLEELAAST